METEREAIRLLVSLAPGLDAESRDRLDRAVLAGPTRSMYRNDIEPERWTRLLESEVWLRLAKMNVVGADAQARLNELSLRHPEWQVKPDESDEFPFWMGGGGEERRSVPAPRRRRELVEWLKRNPGTDIWQDENWSRRCREDFRLAAWALCTLARDNTWPAIRWRQALYVWSEENLIKRSWRYMAPVLAKASGEQLLPLAHEIGQWLKKVTKVFDPDDALFLRFCQAMLKLDYQDDSAEDADAPVTQAINHPVGHVTEALLNWWTRSSLKDGKGLPNTLRPIFTELCDVRIDSFRHGRVLLASRAVTLFRVDGEWTARRLLPLFDWSSSKTEARAAWSGFLWSPRLHRPLMESIKTSFLETASHYDTLDRYDTQYVTLLTSAGLEGGDTFTKPDLRAATEVLPEGGLLDSAEVLVDALEAADERRGEYWRNRVLPYLQSIWPKGIDRKTPQISECLGRLCIAAGDAFPKALEELRRWLQPPKYPGRMMRRLKDSRICNKFPEDALDFLKLVTGDEPPLGDELRECLQQIRSAKPPLKDDPRFRRLRDLLGGHGQELE